MLCGEGAAPGAGPCRSFNLLRADETANEIQVRTCSANDGDLLIFVAGRRDDVNRTLDRVRQHVAHQLGEVPQDKHNFLWVTDFPLFSWNEEERRLEVRLLAAVLWMPLSTFLTPRPPQAVHHPFTAPNQDDWRSGDMRAARALAYDCVYNGVEVGGGSLRIHRSDIQAKVFELIGLDAREATDEFGWLLDALDMGAPPHGGMAFGVDRLIMLIAGAKSIRCARAFLIGWQCPHVSICSHTPTCISSLQ